MGPELFSQRQRAFGRQLVGEEPITDRAQGKDIVVFAEGAEIDQRLRAMNTLVAPRRVGPRGWWPIPLAG